MIPLLIDILRLFGLFVLGFFLLFFGVFRIIRRYHKFPIPAFLTSLIDNPIRRKFIQKPDIVAKRMELAPNMTAVEIGPGKGSYTIAVAQRILPDGKVYAIDIQDGVVTTLKERIIRENIPNIIPRIGDVTNLSFPDESIDRVFAIAALPEIPNPIRALQECHRILKPSGLLILSELLPDPDYPRRKTEVQWAHKAGFQLHKEHGNFFVYQLIFKKTKLR